MATDKKKDNPICELKENTVFEPSPDFPVVGVPVFQAKSRWQGGIAIHVLHKSINCLVDFFLAGWRKFLEASVKAGFEFVAHFYSIRLSKCLRALSESSQRVPCSFFNWSSLAASFL